MISMCIMIYDAAWESWVLCWSELQRYPIISFPIGLRMLLFNLKMAQSKNEKILLTSVGNSILNAKKALKHVFNPFNSVSAGSRFPFMNTKCSSKSKDFVSPIASMKGFVALLSIPANISSISTLVWGGKKQI